MEDISELKASARTCDVDCCENDVYAIGLCGPHATRLRNHGSVTFPLRERKKPGPRPKPGAVSHKKLDPDEKVQRAAGRTASKAPKTHCSKGHALYPENFYKTAKNKIICKQCARDAQARKWGRPEPTYATGPRNADKTHCAQGHEYSAENTRYRSDGSRHCRACEKSQGRASRLLRIYGITTDDFDAMAASQGNRCAICDNEKNKAEFHIDHDHATGKVRRLLCNGCNIGIGQFLEQPDIMRAAADYIEEYKGVSVG